MFRRSREEQSLRRARLYVPSERVQVQEQEQEQVQVQEREQAWGQEQAQAWEGDRAALAARQSNSRPRHRENPDSRALEVRYRSQRNSQPS